MGIATMHWDTMSGGAGAVAFSDDGASVAVSGR